MRLPRWLFIALIIASIFVLSRNMVRSKNEASVFDVPKTLQENSMSLKVWPHSTSNGVEVFSTVKNGGEDDRLYLEPATEFIEILPEFFNKLKDSGYVLNVTGAFYKGRGIPKRYLALQPMPAKYSVFRYETMDVVKQ